MPRMPEIVGEMESAAPELVENEPAEATRHQPDRPAEKQAFRRESEVHVPPWRLRLADFSCEGERAPPAGALRKADVEKR